jgi:hypothetical protein
MHDSQEGNGARKPSDPETQDRQTVHNTLPLHVPSHDTITRHHNSYTDSENGNMSVSPIVTDKLGRHFLNLVNIITLASNYCGKKRRTGPRKANTYTGSLAAMMGTDMPAGGG